MTNDFKPRFISLAFAIMIKQPASNPQFPVYFDKFGPLELNQLLTGMFSCDLLYFEQLLSELILLEKNMLAVALRVEDKCETSLWPMIKGGVVREIDELPEEAPRVDIKGYQFKSDGKTLDIPISILRPSN